MARSSSNFVYNFFEEFGKRGIHLIAFENYARLTVNYSLYLGLCSRSKNFKTEFQTLDDGIKVKVLYSSCLGDEKKSLDLEKYYRKDIMNTVANVANVFRRKLISK